MSQAIVVAPHIHKYFVRGSEIDVLKDLSLDVPEAAMHRAIARLCDVSERRSLSAVRSRAEPGTEEC